MGVRVAVGTVSTTVHRSFNREARGRSRVKVLVDHLAAAICNRCRLPELESENTLTLAALEIRKCDLDSRTRKELARATVKVAMAEEHARER